MNTLKPLHNLCRKSLPRDYFIKMVIDGGTELTFTCGSDEDARRLRDINIQGIDIRAGEFAEFEKVPS